MNRNNEVFQRDTFAELLSRLLARGLSAGSLNRDEVRRCRALLVQQVGLASGPASKGLEQLTSEDFVRSLARQDLELLNAGLSNLATNLVNLHQYRRATVDTNLRIARGQFADLLKVINNDQVRTSLEEFHRWMEGEIGKALQERGDRVRP